MSNSWVTKPLEEIVDSALVSNRYLCPAEAGSAYAT